GDPARMILLADPATQLLRAVPDAQTADSPLSWSMPIRRDSAGCGQAAHSGATVLTRNIRYEPKCRRCRLPASASEQSCCRAEPIRKAAGNTLGVLACRLEAPASLDSDALDRIGRLCRLAGLAIDYAQQRDALQVAMGVWRTISTAVMIVGPDNRIVDVNPAFTQLSGYAAEEVLGRDPKLLRSGHHDVAFYTAMSRALMATGEWQGEIVNRHKDGEEFAEWLSIRTLYDGNGNVLRRIGTFTDITEQKKTAEATWRQANYDQLTGLPNRRLCLDRLQFEIDRMARSGRSLALLFIDLDRFKEINDRLGHPIGDLLLAHAALRICGCVRGTDTVARLGGDEFIVIMSDLSGTDRVGLVAQSIVEGLAAPFHLGGKTVHLSASVGITVYPTDAVMMTDLLAHADQAMYAAKSLGRNRFNYFTPAMQATTVARLGLIKDLRDALAKDQFEVYFQPIVDLASGRAVKAEALLRWHHPTLGLLCPSEFIEAADDSGLIHEIGDWVFRESARWIVRQRRADDGAFQVSVNKSPVQLVAGDTQHSWLEYLKQVGVPGQCLVIEVTEDLLLSGRPEILSKLQRLQQAGVGLAIDDFGTGYSALSCLKALAVDYLKIDRVFIRDLLIDADVETLVRAIIAMAHAMGITVIAEGVERVEQR
ncbi:MAG: EAL domain-containing protein, partial [Gammaproteobacteria bacterium]|nr:EAL domain-containing protein [Gammaproteobacteria bacterium]